MPQDGANNYQYPPGTPGIPDTTIESEAYNTFLDDLVVNDLNIPRPIHRGGTAATTAHQALINLKGEECLQNVDNYDTFPSVSGSFFSAAGATAAPTSTDKFSGICYIYDADTATIEARVAASATVSTNYVRQKTGGVWGAWMEQIGALATVEGNYVNVVGDIMTGNLTLPVNATPDAAHAIRKDYVDAAGVSLKTYIDAADATLTAAVDGKVSKSGDTMSGSLNIDASLTLSAAAAAGGYALFYSGDTSTIRFNNNSYSMWSSPSLQQSQIVFAGGYYLQMYAAGAGAFNINVEAYKPGGGPWVALSDARIKNVLGNYENSLASVLALQPVRFTFKGNDTLEAPGAIEKARGEKEVPGGAAPYPNSSHYHVAQSGKEFIGLVAQAVEPLFPEMVNTRSGYIDGVQVNDMRDIDTTPLIFALINSIKELNARIEALEAT